MEPYPPASTDDPRKIRHDIRQHLNNIKLMAFNAKRAFERGKVDSAAMITRLESIIRNVEEIDPLLTRLPDQSEK
jgi:phosphoglycerate-specific signal transduction histidine kinase